MSSMVKANVAREIGDFRPQQGDAIASEGQSASSEKPVGPDALDRLTHLKRLDRHTWYVVGGVLNS